MGVTKVTEKEADFCLACVGRGSARVVPVPHKQSPTIRATQADRHRVLPYGCQPRAQQLPHLRAFDLSSHCVHYYKAHLSPATGSAEIFKSRRRKKPVLKSNRRTFAITIFFVSISSSRGCEQLRVSRQITSRPFGSCSNW